MELLYIWVEDFQNIKKQGFNFNPRYHFTYNPDTNELSLEERPDAGTPANFFGENIANVTAIVGENGSGKSSLLLLLKSIYTEKIPFVIYLESPSQSKYSILVDNKFNDFVNITCNFDFSRKTKSNVPFVPLFVPTENINSPHTEKFIPIHDYTLNINTFGFNLDTQVDFIHDHQTKLESLIPFDTPTYLWVFVKNIDSILDINQFSTNNKHLFEDDIIISIYKNNENSTNYNFLSIIEKLTLNIILFLINEKNNTYKNNEYTVEELKNFTELSLYFKNQKSVLEDIFPFVLQKLPSLGLKAYEPVIKNLTEYLKSDDSIKIIPIQNGFLLNIKNKRSFEKFSKIQQELLKNINNTTNSANRPHPTISSNLIDYKWVKNQPSPQQHTSKSKWFMLDSEVLYLSTGEARWISFLSELYYCFKKKGLDYKTQSSILICLDEPDTTLHPEWQRIFINSLLNFLTSFKNLTFQLVFTTHSPFLLSDLPNGNVMFLKKDANGNCQAVDNALQDNRKTFAANIHSLLADGFFMQNGLIGEFAKGKINRVIGLLVNNENKLTDSEQHEVQTIINMIGEPIIRHKLMQLYNEKMQFNTEKSLQNHDSRIKELEDKIKQLENKIANNNPPTE